jgi:hypothetical protein
MVKNQVEAQVKKEVETKEVLNTDIYLKDRKESGRS